MLRNLAAKLPPKWQQEVKRIHYGRQIGKSAFATDEPEFAKLADWLKPGDWVIDIGANVGHYTLELSRLVGPEGRVIAFEPIPATFELLSANCRQAANDNVTLFNAAVSKETRVARMTIPKWEHGLHNFYEARLNGAGEDGVPVLCVGIDGLDIEDKVKLVKIDAEGHEASVLRGMEELIGRDRPILIIEGRTEEIDALLSPHGYVAEELPGSPNAVYHARAD
jgi:FkbM family methyltransferase